MMDRLSQVASILAVFSACGMASQSFAQESDKSQIASKASDSGNRRQPSVELILKPSERFVVSGVEVESAEQGPKYFYITVETEDLKQPPRLLGKYQFQNDELAFIPRFPLSPGVLYRMHLVSPRLRNAIAEPARLLFELPARKTTATAKVTAVYPTADSLPENLLKFYIHFSEPMNRGQAYKRIHLLRGDEPVDSPFLELGEELWDGEQTRFTLFLHPGRIKRGLKPREEAGPPLALGSEYTLRIDKAWTAAEGLTLVDSFEKKFRVMPADHEQPDLEAWKIETPRKDTRQPVGLLLNEPLDHAMLRRVLTVKHQSGRVITGSIEISEQESKWEFTPDEAWPVGTYNVEVAANLEDLCGNSIARPFEVKMQQRTAALPSTKVAIEFIVK